MPVTAARPAVAVRPRTAAAFRTSVAGRVAFTTATSVLLGVGVGLAIGVGGGVDAFNTAAVAAAGHSPLTTGTAGLAGTVAAFAAAWALARLRPGPANVIGALVVAPVIDRTVAATADLAGAALAVRAGLGVAAVALVIVALSSFVAADVGAGPLETLATAISARSALAFPVARNSIDVALLTAAWAAGTAPGLITAAFALVTGPGIARLAPRIRARL